MSTPLPCFWGVSMAIPAIPTHFTIQQGNGQVLLTWDTSAGALSYDVQRSLDNITFASIATPGVPTYLDTAVTIGVVYYYKVAATNGDGTSAYTTSQLIVPTVSGAMSLGQLRLLAKQRADLVTSQHVSDSEWNQYINQSAFELYDILVRLYEDYYVLPPLIIVTDGVTTQYPLPDGILYSGARPFYKLIGVDLGLDSTNNARITLNRFEMISRNQFVFPNVPTTFLAGYNNLRYHLVDNRLFFIPTPAGNQFLNIWYIPKMTQLLKDSDILDGVSGWTEYVIVDAAIKAKIKEETPIEELMAVKVGLLDRIEKSATNRDAGQPAKISRTRRNNRGWGGYGGYGEEYY